MIQVNQWVHWEIGGSFYDAYQTGPCLLGIARSGAPTATVSGGALNGFTYKQVAQMAVDWIGSAQITSGQGIGAWYYNKDAGNTTGDQSATGWATLGLGYAVHSMGCTWPAGLLTRLAQWNAYIQCPTPGTDFGGAGYTSVCSWNNIYKTGHLLFNLGLTGKTVADQAVIDALTYMHTHWADANADPGWLGSSATAPHCIAIASASKGFTELGIETFSGHNWYNDFADRVVGAQYADGHWRGGGPHGDPDTVLSTCWSLLGLLRATSHFPPVVTTNAADNLGPFTATLHGNLTDMGTAATVDLSFQYGTTSGDLTSETTPAAYSSTLPYAYSAAISGLTMGTRYYFRAKAVGDATGYGDELYFDTLPVPSVTTTAVTAISNVSATSGGNVTADNGTPVTAYGVCWSTSANPTIADSHTTDGTGTGIFSSSITPLAASTVYHVRAYATNTAGTGYGADIAFTTAAIVTASAGANGSLDATTPSPVIVNYNSTTSFTFNADANYHVASVSGCSGTPYTNTSNAVTSYTYTTGAVTGACTVTATFAINTYTITATSGANGSVTPAGVTTVNHDASQTYAITPGTGYHIVDVLVDSSSVGAVASYSFSNVTANHTISATFTINTYTITASSGANGSVTPAGVTTINYGGSQTYSITPTTGHHTVDVLVDAASMGPVSSYTFNNVTAIHTISATFAINTYTVTASAGVNGALDGTTPSPATVNYGSTASFTFNANTGYHVTSISGCGGTAYSNTTNEVAAYTYTTAAITTDCAVAATFAINIYQVDFFHNANGHLSGELSQIREHGLACSPVTAIPDLGYRLQEWSGDYTGIDNPLTIRNVTSNMDIHAVFINDPPQVTIVSPLDGSTAFGVVTVQADISDDTRIAGVEFYVDNNLQERVTADQAGARARLADAAKKALKEVSPSPEPGAPDPILQKGTWQFDLRGAQAIFITPERKARKVDGSGLVSAIIRPDVDIAQLQLLPQIHSLAVAFSEPQALMDGKPYAVVLADFSRGELFGLEAAPAWIVGNFSTSQTFQTDGLNSLYYLMYNAKQTLVMRSWNPARQSRTVFTSDHPIQEWQVAEEGAIILKSVSTAKGMSPIRIWHPRLGWIGENQSLLAEQTRRQWSHTAVSRGLGQSQHLESYFPQNAEIQPGRFDDIQAVSLLGNVILIAGSQAGMARVEILDREGNSSIIVPTGSLEIAKASWVNDRLAILAGFDPLAQKYVLARLQWQPSEPPEILSFAELSEMPLQVQGTAFSADSQAQTNEAAPKAGERKELPETLSDPAARLSETGVSSVSAHFNFTMDTMNFSVDNHALRVVAYDDAHASGADEITVKVAKVKLDLLAERRTVLAFSILRHYGQIQFLVEDFGIPAAQYRILRKKGAGDFELLRAITPAELQNNQFQMQDKYLETGTAYTYRVEAYNAAGELYGFSVEKTI